MFTKNVNVFSGHIKIPIIILFRPIFHNNNNNTTILILFHFCEIIISSSFHIINLVAQLEHIHLKKIIHYGHHTNLSPVYVSLT